MSWMFGSRVRLGVVFSDAVIFVTRGQRETGRC